MSMCDTPHCTEVATRDDRNGGHWCFQHYGTYPHPCEQLGCNKTVIFDDEPFCFAHSPDEGSSAIGYSARARASAVNAEHDT